MSNTSLGIVLLIVAALCSLVLFSSIGHREKSDASLWLALLCISNALWTICNALFYLVPDDNAALFFLNARFAFISLSSLLTYLFAFKSLRHRMLNARALMMLFSVPMITLLIILTNDYHGLMRHSVEMVYVSGIRTVKVANGLWFWIHCLFSYMCLSLSFSMMVIQYRRVPKNYKSPIGIMLAAITLTMATTLLSVLNLLPYDLDPAPIVIEVSQVFFYYAVFHSRSVDMLFTSRDTIFENINYPVLVLDQQGIIMDYNLKAMQVGACVGLSSLFEVPYKTFIDSWLAGAGGRIFAEDNSIFTVTEGNADAHYQVSQTEILNAHGKPIGSYAEIKSITPIMTLIHKLKVTSYYDLLTGLHNRHYFSKMLVELDNESSLPLGVLVGDIDSLKQVNDTYGHAYGDMLLQAVTGVLTEYLPQSAVMARTGGDEFVGLFPNTSQAQMQEFAASIEARCRTLELPEFVNAGISLGFQIKYGMGENIAELMNDADMLMYSHKYGANDGRRFTMPDQGRNVGQN